jgi:hypothetical protein
MLTGRSPQASADGRALPLGGAPRALRVPSSLLPAGFEKILWRASTPAAGYGSLASLVAALLPHASHAARTGYTRRTEALRSPRSSSREPSLAHALAHGHASEAPGRGRAWELGGLLGVAFALSVGIAVGAAQGGKDAPVRLEAAQEPVPLATAVSPNAVRMLRVTPAQAEASIDGQKLGSGAVSLGPFSDDTLHTLRVEAPGYVTRVVLFRGAPDVQHIGLVAAPTARFSRAPFAAEARR